jgi:hypothetical protein
MQVEPFCELGERRLWGLATRVGDEAHDVRLLGHPPVGVEHGDGIELAARRRDRALEIGRFGIEDAVELAAQGTGHLAGLEFQERPRGADPPKEGPDRLAALPGDDPASAPKPPGRGQADLPQSRREDRRVVRRQHELEMGPATRQAQRAAGQEAATQPGGAAMLGCGGPFERGHHGGLPRSSQPHGQTGHRRLTRADLRTQACRFGHPVARTGRVDRGQLIAQGRHEIPFRACHLRRSYRRSGAASTSPPRGRA